MAPLKRTYNCKDVEVLTVSSEIVSNAQANLAAITAERASWVNPFFPDLKTRINTAFTTYLGVDNAKEMREKTAALTAVIKPAKRDLSKFKVNVEQDFKNNKPRLNEILNTLGYKLLWKDVNKGDQEATIELLYRFKTNMTPALTTEITTAGTSLTLITAISGYADTLKNANVDQEFAKSQRPLTSSAAVAEFNAIYDIIITVCKICRNIFKDDSIKRDNFSFNGTKKRLNAATPPPPGP